MLKYLRLLPVSYSGKLFQGRNQEKYHFILEANDSVHVSIRCCAKHAHQCRKLTKPDRLFIMILIIKRFSWNKTLLVCDYCNFKVLQLHQTNLTQGKKNKSSLNKTKIRGNKKKKYKSSCKRKSNMNKTPTHIRLCSQTCSYFFFFFHSHRQIIQFCGGNIDYLSFSQYFKDIW